MPPPLNQIFIVFHWGSYWERLLPLPSSHTVASQLQEVLEVQSQPQQGPQIKTMQRAAQSPALLWMLFLGPKKVTHQCQAVGLGVGDQAWLPSLDEALQCISGSSPSDFLLGQSWLWEWWWAY